MRPPAGAIAAVMIEAGTKRLFGDRIITLDTIESPVRILSSIKVVKIKPDMLINDKIFKLKTV